MTITGPPLGAHLSISGGTWRAVERARRLGCTALQIFTQAPGRWRGRAIPGDEASRFRRAVEEAGLEGVVFAHAPYLINLAAGDETLRRRSVDLLLDQLARAGQLGLAGLVLHPGAHVGDGVEAGLARCVAALQEVLARAPDAPPILVEVTAGQGSALGRSLAEVAFVVERLPTGRSGVCWDTAHLWAAGYDVEDPVGWESLWREFHALLGRRAPDLVHLNDTDVELGSRVDRHARIGHGRLGYDTFSRIVRDPRLAAVPMVIETPKGPDEETWDRETLEFLRSAAGG